MQAGKRLFSRSQDATSGEFNFLTCGRQTDLSVRIFRMCVANK